MIDARIPIDRLSLISRDQNALVDVVITVHEIIFAAEVSEPSTTGEAAPVHEYNWEFLENAVKQEHSLGVGIVVTLVLLALLALLLKRRDRRFLRGPLLTLVACAVLIVVHGITTPATQLHKTTHFVALFLLMAAIGRCLFLLLFRSRLAGGLFRPLPTIFLEIIQAAIYFVVLLLTLSAVGVEPTSLVTGSALVTAAIGFSLRDTLGNVVAGLAIQLQQPFAVGDWIQFDEHSHHVGEVIEINWRATKVITLDLVEVTVPNEQLARAPIRNFTKPEPYSRRSIYVVTPYEVPTQRVQKIILDAVVGAFGVLTDPPPSVVTNRFTERGVEFWVRIFTTEFGKRDKVDGSVRDRIWYALNRNGITIPGSQHHVALEQVGPETHEKKEQIRHRQKLDALRFVALLEELSEEAMEDLAAAAEQRHYGAGEVIIRQGDKGSEMFIITSGEVSVTHEGDNGAAHEMSKLRVTDFFGEMACMTGNTRVATVAAVVDCELYAIPNSAFAPILEASPKLADHMSEVLAARQEAIANSPVHAKSNGDDDLTDSRLALLNRIRDFFSLA